MDSHIMDSHIMDSHIMDSQKTYAELKSQYEELGNLARKYKIDKDIYDASNNAIIKKIENEMENMKKEMKIFNDEPNEYYKSYNSEKYGKIKSEYNKSETIFRKHMREKYAYQREYNLKMCDIDQNVKKVLNQIKQYDNMEDMKIMIDDNMKYIDGFHLLNENELIAITSNIDKTDYRKFDSGVSRWLDLERTIKRTIQLKKYYPEWTLVKLCQTWARDSIPPLIGYSYVFSDNYGSDITVNDNNI